jgi:hypothetical protein
MVRLHFPESKGPPVQEFFQAAEAYAKKARRVAISVEITMDGGRWLGRTYPQVPFFPKWFLIEPIKDALIRDVKYGSISQLMTAQSIPASLYSMDEALSLFDSPDSPAWDRFKMEPRDGEPIQVGQSIAVQLEPGGAAWPATIRAVFIGDEPHFHRWDGHCTGTVEAVAMTRDGPIVTIRIVTGTVNIPIAAADIKALAEKIGRPVKFHIEA